MSTRADIPAETIRGIVRQVYFASPAFSAGALRSDDGEFVKFRGRFFATEGDVVAVRGRWVKDKKYGRQFDVDGLGYDLPENENGLTNYLASHPAFKGVGRKTAEKIVGLAGNARSLDRLIRHQLNELHDRLRIPMPVLQTLQDAWVANEAENEIRTYLASFGLTHHQMDVLLATYGNGIVGVLRSDPYQLIKRVNGYGFKKVDAIARKIGVPKRHPGRIEAAITYCLNEEIGNGHTWTGGSDLLNRANDALLLDELDSRKLIRASADAMLARGEIVADGTAVTTPSMLDAERLIFDTLRRHAKAGRGRIPAVADESWLNRGQSQAYRAALSNNISVISGGAGTGKTFVLARLAGGFRASGMDVAICAPTGKAAKRVEEVMRQHGLDLKAQTIHRLLGYDGSQFNCGSLSAPSANTAAGFDVVIADETSMVDVPLLAELFRRIDFARTQVVLVGDHNQLPPVGPGNILRDIIRGNLAPNTVLNEVVRQAGILKANSTAILSGTIAPTAVNDPGWIVIDSFRETQQIQTYLRDLLVRIIPDRLGYDPVKDVQIITPTHKGLLGTQAINRMVQFLLHGRVERKFAVGDKVIQTANDYEMGVMNGTIGHVVDVEGGDYFVQFENGHSNCQRIDGERLSNVQLAYALTAHKAQGSEFRCAIVLCHKSHYFADRNWLYTAVTRAAKTCILLGDRWGLHRAVEKNNTIKRRTFLGLWSGRKEVAHE